MKKLFNTYNIIVQAYNTYNNKLNLSTDMISQKIQLSDKIEIKNARYYMIINKNQNQALYISSGAKKFEEEKAQLGQPNPQSLGQVWQIIQIDPDGFRKKGLYQVVHTRSTLVLTKLKSQFILKKLYDKTQQNEVRLRFGEWLDTQLYYLEQVHPKDFPNIYRFSSYENRRFYLFYDKFLRLEEIDPMDDRCHWQIKPCYENPIINRSCYIQNAYSSLAVDVPAGSLKTGCNLIQYPLNNRFNQRFNIYKSGIYFKIANLNSKLFITTNRNPIAGEVIKQEANCDQLYQMWNLEYQGKNLYIIRSAKNIHLMLGIRDHTIKAETPLIITTNEEFALWRIVGFVPR